MALSFEDSLNANFYNSITPNTFGLRTMALDDSPIELVEEPLVEENSWILCDRYQVFEDYSDEKYSYVDEEKNITLSSGQINITQETNSQYVQFEMYRYYDGFDLMNTSIVIHFVNVNYQEGYSSPINLYYNNEKIRFAWLIDNRVTVTSGNVSFEIIAIGKNSKGNSYVWKTKSIDKIEVLCSLSGNGEILADEDWITSFVLEMKENVETVENAIEEVRVLSDQTKTDLLTIAENTKLEMRSIADESKQEIDIAVQDASLDLTAAKESAIYAIDNSTAENQDEIEELSNQIKTDLANNIDVAMTELQTFIDNAKIDLQNDIDQMVSNFNVHVDVVKSDIQSAIDQAKADIQAMVDEAKADIDDTINFVEISNSTIDSMFE